MITDELIDILKVVDQMRSVQRRWFSGDKSSTTLQESKELEKKVDRLLDKILRPDPQGSLF